MTLVEGDMRDLSRFADGSFDLIVHPISNCFVPQIRGVWAEAYRVLRSGGELLAGFSHPLCLMLDPDLEKQGVATIKHPAPYSDLVLSTEEHKRLYGEGAAMGFGHTLQDQIGGQLDAGFLLAGFYEDRHPPEHQLLSAFLAPFAATRAIKR